MVAAWRLLVRVGGEQEGELLGEFMGEQATSIFSMKNRARERSKKTARGRERKMMVMSTSRKGMRESW